MAMSSSKTGMDGHLEDVDCDDSDPTAYPGAVEICDELDNNCDGQIDETGVVSYRDADEDSYGAPAEQDLDLRRSESRLGHVGRRLR